MVLVLDPFDNRMGSSDGRGLGQQRRDGHVQLVLCRGLAATSDHATDGDRGTDPADDGLLVVVEVDELGRVSTVEQVMAALVERDKPAPRQPSRDGQEQGTDRRR